MNTSPFTDAAEIAHFAALSSTWWDEQGPMRMLHAMNPLRLRFIQECMGQDFKGLHVLDIGCGAGIVSEPLARLGATVTGLDENDAALTIAKARAESQKLSIQYAKANSADWKHQGHEYDLITALEVMEHVPHPQAFLDDAATMLKPHGVLVVSTLNRTPLAKITALTLAENVLGLLPKGTHTYERFITPDDMQSMAQQSGLDRLAQKGIRPTLDGRGWVDLPTHNTALWVNYIASFKRHEQQKDTQ